MRSSSPFFLGLLILISCLPCHGQLVQSGDLYDEVASIISGLPGDAGNDYREPNAQETATWENTLNALLAGDTVSASDSANLIGYQLIALTDTTFSPAHSYYLLTTNGSNHWGSYAYYPDYCRPLVIQSPHPKKDANTGLQGIHVFLETKAFFYQLSGTHRCNSPDASSCSGTTSTCSGSSEAYRISDLAHTTTSIFQKTTEVLLAADTTSHFIQLHGFTKLSTDPYVILSNGTQVTPATDYMAIFATQLKAEDSILTTKIAHIDTDWTRLRGFWNTQGRLINQEADPCNSDAASSEGRFFHVEQERTRLRSDIDGWDKVANALNKTFACQAASTSLFSPTTPQQIKLYPNPSGQRVTIEWQAPHTKGIDLSIYNQIGQNMTHRIHVLEEDRGTIVLQVGELPAGQYFISLGNVGTTFYKE